MSQKFLTLRLSVNECTIMCVSQLKLYPASCYAGLQGNKQGFTYSVLINTKFFKQHSWTEIHVSMLNEKRIDHF